MKSRSRIKKSNSKRRSSRRPPIVRSRVKRRTPKRSVKSKSKSKRSVKTKKEEKIKKYFRSEIKKYGDDYFLGSVWRHPITNKQVRITDRDKTLFKQVKKELNITGVRCKVKRSPDDKKENLIKELRSYVKCWEKRTTRNQDLPLSRLKSESVPQIKKHLSFYRSNNKF